MGFLFNDRTDDVPVMDAAPGYSGGQVSNERASALQLEQYALAVNLDRPTRSTMDTRRGTRSLGNPIVSGVAVQGLIWYDHIEGSSPVRELFAIIDGDSYVWDGASWTVQLPTVTNSTVQAQIAQQNDKLYVADGTANIFSWDGTTWSDLGSGGATNPPAAASIIVSIQNRLAVAGVTADPTALHFTDVLSEVWDTANNVVSVGKGENDGITCLQPWVDGVLVVFKAHSTWVVVCTAATIAEFGIKRLHETVGCVGPRASCQVGNDVWFLGQSGIHSIKRDVSGLNQEVTVPVSQPIQDLIDRINWSAASSACATFFDNRVLFGVPLDGATTPNYVIVYSTLTQSWSGYWTNWNPNIFAITNFNDTQELVFGRTDGRVRRWLTQQGEGAATTYQDDGTPIATTLKTRAMICGEAFNPKQPFWAEWEYNNSEANCRMSLVPDGTSSYQVADASTQNPVLTLPFTLPATLLPNGVKRIRKHIQHRPQFREMQLLMETDSGKVRHRAAYMSGFVETCNLHDE